MALALSIPGGGTAVLFSTTATGPYTVPSFTPTAGAGIVMGAVMDQAFSGAETLTPDTPTWLVSAFTPEAQINHTTQAQMGFLWSGTVNGSPGADSIVLTAGGGAAPLGCNIVVVEITGQDTSDFVLQPEGNQFTGSTSRSDTLAGALAAATSVCLAFFQHSTNEVHNPSGSETELAGSDGGHTAPTRRISAQYIVNNTTNGCSWTTSSFGVSLLCEIVEATGGAATSLLLPNRNQIIRR
jgi:hypothetical protein